MEDTNTRASTPRPRPDAIRPYLMVIEGARVGELHELIGERTVVGRSPDAQIRLADDGISRAHAELVVEGGHVKVRDLGSTNGTFCNGVRADVRELHDGDKLSVGRATLLVFTHQDGIARDYRRGRLRAAMRDPATSTLRREIFVERLVEEVSFARRHAAPLSVLSWEIDGFAALEARLGPTATRQRLAAIARAVAEVLQQEDLFARLGPGKFGVACRETGARAAREVGARLREAVARAAFEDGGPHASVTASVGVAVSGSGVDKTAAAAEALLLKADAALGLARARGGDRVELDAAASDPE